MQLVVFVPNIKTNRSVINTMADPVLELQVEYKKGSLYRTLPNMRQLVLEVVKTCPDLLYWQAKGYKKASIV